MPPAFRPIVPRNLDIANATGLAGKLLRAMNDMGADIVADMGKYPTQAAGVTYVRTDELLQSWSSSGPQKKGIDIVVKVGSRAKHAPFVQGWKTRRPSAERQRKLFASYNWQSIEDVSDKVIKDAQPKIQALLAGKK